MGKRIANKVLLLGWDAADLDIINPMIEAGELPTIAKFFEGSAVGRLATLNPPLSPILWSSITTGMNGDKHGVLNFIQSNESGQPVPVSVNKRKKKALWNILSDFGFKTNVINWWPSHPVEKVNGVYISEFFTKVSSKSMKVNDLPNLTYPSALYNQLKGIRLTPDQLCAEHLLPFVPLLNEIDHKNDRRITTLSKVLCECLNTLSATTWTLENTDWDFTAAYFPDIDHFCHGFMRYHPPKTARVSDADYRLYNGVVKAAYKLHDMVLNTLLNHIPKDTTVLLCSDHGFYSDERRPLGLTKDEPAGPAREHSNYGVFALNGPGVRPQEPIGANLLNIAPTVLDLFGLPASEEFEGNALSYLYRGGEPQLKVQTFESDKEKESDESIDMDYQHLIDMGYVDKHDLENVEDVELESYMNLAQIYFSKGEYEKSIEQLDQYLAIKADHTKALYNMWRAYFELGDVENCRRYLVQLEQGPNIIENHLGVLDAQIDMLEGKLVIANKKLEGLAESGSRKAIQALGKVQLKRKKWDEALKTFRRLISLDGTNAVAHIGAGRALMKLDSYADALDAYMTALNLNFNNAEVHFLIGECYFMVEQYQPAARAIELSLKFDSTHVSAYEYLKRIYANHIPDPERFKKYEQAMLDLQGGEVIVVAGLPRSGTSLMMQLLEKSGVPLFVDGERKADEDNPKGYYEHEVVKGIVNSTRRFNGMAGKAVKVVTPLVLRLPMRYKYKVIYMHRDAHEVMQSQLKMVGDRSETFRNRLFESLAEQERQSIEYLERMDHISCVHIDYNKLMDEQNIDDELQKLSSFLLRDFGAAKEVVDKRLYRNKVELELV